MNVGRSGQWRPSVQPFLEELGEQLKAKGRSDHSVSLDVAGLRVLVTPLEQELVLSMMGEGEESFARKHILVRDALGLRIKLQSLLEEVESESTGEERDSLLNQINADVGLGCQLMHEITLEMKAITAAGAITEAREFSSYRQQLVRVVTRAERAISGRTDSSGRHGVVGRGGYAPKPTIRGSAAAAQAAQAPRAGSGRLRWWIVAVIVALCGVAAGVAWWLLR